MAVVTMVMKTRDDLCEEGTQGTLKPETEETRLYADIFSATGLTSTYSRSRVGRLGAVVRAGWAYHFYGGAGDGEIVIEGGVPTLDDAVREQHEVEILRGGVVWYRGRVANFKQQNDEGTGRIYTTILLEGYATRLRTLMVDRLYTAKTVAFMVKDILDTYVTPKTRIAYTAADVVGAYTAGKVDFRNRSVADAFNVLANLQGTTEWGVTEGSPKPQFYFVPESSTQDPCDHVVLGQKGARLVTEGVFKESWNAITVVGGIIDGAPIKARVADATAGATYGLQEKTIIESAFLTAADAQRYAQNWVDIYKDGQNRYVGTVKEPTERLEAVRTGASPYSGTNLASFWGTAGTKFSLPFTKVAYEYVMDK